MPEYLGVIAAIIGVIAAIIGVGVALAALILRGQNNTNQRIDGLSQRLLEVEKGQARLEGYLAGQQNRNFPEGD